jgi:hypothetical protein
LPLAIDKRASSAILSDILMTSAPEWPAMEDASLSVPSSKT